MEDYENEADIMEMEYEKLEDAYLIKDDTELASLTRDEKIDKLASMVADCWELAGNPRNDLGKREISMLPDEYLDGLLTNTYQSHDDFLGTAMEVYEAVGDEKYIDQKKEPEKEMSDYARRFLDKAEKQAQEQDKEKDDIDR